MKNLELVSLLKGTKNENVGYWITLRGKSSGQVKTVFLEYTNKHAVLRKLRLMNVECPHSAYRN